MSVASPHADSNSHYEPPPRSLLPYAEAFLAAGLCVIPVKQDGSKRPGLKTWEEYQERLPTLKELVRWFHPQQRGMGVVTGKVSGNVETLDFDHHDLLDSFYAAARGVGRGALLDRMMAGYWEQSPNGDHLPYRCETIAGSKKLAMRYEYNDDGTIKKNADGSDAVKTLIETKGEGGFIISAPSDGPTHETGTPYALKSGGPETIVEITPDERKMLHDLARSFTEIPVKPAEEERSHGAHNGATGERPGDIFNARASWEQVLEPAGWTCVFERNGVGYWRRPGKDRDWSATTNHAGSDLLYVFSTSTVFESNRGYGKFSAYAFLNHNGDFTAAAEDLMKQGYRQNGARSHAAGSTEDAADRPRIVVNNRQLRDVIDEALTMLVNANDPPSLFQRANALVHVLRDEYGRPAITTMSEAGVVERLTRGADFFTEHAPPKGASEKKIVSVDPPKGLVNVLHGSPDWPFPALVGLCECPVLRPDGSVVDQPGYDPATRLLYQPMPGLTLPAIPATPTRAQAQAARQFLCDELFADFPFCADADKANMLATLLTPILRPAIQGHVPLCLIDKPSAGSGATLLADVVGTVSTGTHAGKATMPTGRGGEEEMRKKIFSVLLTAREVVVLDNIDHALASSELASVLTAGFKEDRPLGSSRNIRVPARVFWIATANNIALRGDLARRSYRVRIDPKVDRPWTREGFRHPELLAWIREQRGPLLAALLTMARGWFANGKPAATITPPKIGSFEEWVDTLAGILSFAGMPEFLTNLEELYDMVDEDAAQWSVFIQTWHAQLGDKAITVAELASTLQTVPDLLDALPESLGWDTEKLTSSKHKLGFALKKRRDKHFGGYRLEQDTKDPHTQKPQWKVRHVHP